jgi:hypothetical protein
MHDISLEENHFTAFLNLFTHYMCSRCEGCPPYHTEQDNTDGSGRHSHNGEILNHWQGAAPTGLRILSAYRYYSSIPHPSNIQRGLAKAYNTPNNRGISKQPYAVAAQRLLDAPDLMYLRHGIEQPSLADYKPDATFPPEHSRHHIGEYGLGRGRELQRYAVDMDTPPFVTCTAHRGDRETHQPWADVAGYISIRDFRRLGGTLHKPRDRDHLYAHGSIAAQHWTYIYRDIPSTEDRADRLQALTQLRNSGLPALHEQTLHRLFKLRTLLHNYSQAWSAIKP